MRTLLKDWIGPWRAYAAEFLGTFVFVLIASGSVLTNVFYGNVGILGIALATGLSLTAMIYATSPFSGGHLNPAVTLALWLVQKIESSRAIFYIAAQTAASFCAAATLLFIYGDRALKFTIGAPSVVVSEQVALVIEVVLTSVLVFVVFATMIDKAGEKTTGPLAIGLVVVVATIMAGPLSGAVLNPARVLGPMILTKTYAYLAIYMVGPAMGSLFGVIYDFLFLRKSKK
ncbi:aquaporin [Candidatus Curtissbacteria bacterium]|nr:aquaporin [Candidatus Curtissbacteria bacterium]